MVKATTSIPVLQKKVESKANSEKKQKEVLSHFIVRAKAQRIIYKEKGLMPRELETLAFFWAYMDRSGRDSAPFERLVKWTGRSKVTHSRAIRCLEVLIAKGCIRCEDVPQGRRLYLTRKGSETLRAYVRWALQINGNLIVSRGVKKEPNLTPAIDRVGVGM